MAKVEIKKLSLIGLKSEEDEIIKALHKLGSVEIIDVKSDPESESLTKVESNVLTEDYQKYSTLISKSDFTLSFMDRVSPYKKGLFEEKASYTENEMKDMLDDSEAALVMDKCKSLDDELSRLKNEEVKLTNTLQTVEPWEPMDIRFDALKGTASSNLYLGSMQKVYYQDFIDSLKQESDRIYIEKINEVKELVYVLVMAHKDDDGIVDEALKNYSFAKADTAGLKNTPKEEISDIQEKLSQINQKREEINQEVLTMIDTRPKIQIINDYAKVLLDREEQNKKLYKTDYTFMLKGFVPVTFTDKVEKTLKEMTDTISIEFTDVTEEDDVPTYLENKKLVEPFEMVTNLYSPPSREDLDPNPTMAPFFFVFFGLMLSDAGYGLVITLGALFLLKKMKPQGMMKQLMQLMVLGGISTIFWGVMFGGYFGDLLSNYIKPIWLNPIDDPMTLLIFSFVCGFIHIFAGLGLKAYRNIKEGNVFAAVFDQGFWVILILSLVCLALPAARPIAKWVAIAAVIGLVLTQGREKAKPIQKLFSGVTSLYDITSYLSDILSYARILALGLATGVIGMVINTVARMLGTNVIGYVFMIIILIGGHIFNIAINALGAYVHTSRLQYVEFFGKFYDGGGRLFDPFRIKTKYTNYKESEEI